ncbi:MAG: glycine cleavage system aminomethyltransferase GcvT [Actinomycetota bacterium]
MTVLLSPLHDWHVTAGAKMADFGGWSMPVEYPLGVVAEHLAVRESVGVFDVSHLGTVTVHGGGAADFVNRCFTADLTALSPGQAHYTLCCNPMGGVVDDLIVYLRSPNEVFLVPNAANVAEVLAMLVAAAPPEIDVRRVTLAVVAVQGPRSVDVLEAVGLKPTMEYLSFTDVQWRAEPVILCRTGYTGERGYEIVTPISVIKPLWDSLIDAARVYGGGPAGLGARDTLRTEMGYALHGHELTPSTTPVAARLGWAVGWGKPVFWGREALVAERERGAAQRLWGLLAQGRGIPRPCCSVYDRSGIELGRTTSGTFSPTLRTGIALAFLDASVRPGVEVVLDVRGRAVPCQVVVPPFVSSRPAERE